MKRRLCALAASAAWLVLASGCSEPDPQAPSPQQYKGAEVQSIPENVIAAAVVVRAAAYDSTYIEYHAAAGPVSRTPAIGFAGDTVARVPVLGLDTATAYTFRVVLARTGAADETVDSLPFSSGSLPAWIPAIGSIGTSGETGYLALSLPEGAVTVDNSGKVVWYHYSPNGTLNSFQAHPAGVYTLLGTGPAETEFHVLNALGEETGRLACVGRPTRFHELLVDAGGDAWLLCDDTRTMDLSAVAGSTGRRGHRHRGTAPLARRRPCSGSGTPSTISPSPTSQLVDRTGATVNFTHGNGIGFDSDSNLILGFRSLSEVTKVDRSTGAVIWRLGGLANQFTIPERPQGAVRAAAWRARGPARDRSSCSITGSAPPAASCATSSTPRR